MYKPYWLIDQENIKVEVSNIYVSDDPSNLKVEGCRITYGLNYEGSITTLIIDLCISQEILFEDVGNINSLVNLSILAYLYGLKSSGEWYNQALSENIICKLAVQTLTYVLSNILKDGTPKELKEVCKTICFLSDYMVRIRFEFK